MNAIVPRILMLEPWYGGSHRGFVDLLMKEIDADWQLVSLPGRHWKWRARGSAPYFAQTIPREDYDVVFASAYLHWPDLLALRPELRNSSCVLYFHENQFAYPVKTDEPRDNHFGFSQLVAAAAADTVVFNSNYNRTSFLEGATQLLKVLPDAKPSALIAAVRDKAQVLGVPIRAAVQERPIVAADRSAAEGPLILWPHRWEYDKNPGDFFEAMQAVLQDGLPFRLAVCGQRNQQWPTVFDDAKDTFRNRILHFGPAEAYEYINLLDRADIVVSTAIHEFFGVSMLEATAHGAYPLVPDRLAYPENYPTEHLYAQEGLRERIVGLIERYMGGETLRAPRPEIVGPFGRALLEKYEALLEAQAAPS